MSAAGVLQQYSSIDKEKSEYLNSLEQQIQTLAEISNSDVLLDYIIGDNAIVLAHAVPTSKSSAFDTDITGSLFDEKHQPAVFKAFHLGMPVCDNTGLTNDGRTFRQDVTPIKNDNGEVVAVIACMKDISSDILKEKKYEHLLESYEAKNSNLSGINLKQDEETVVIREIHHRIKNNLQLTASILDMQARRSDNEEVKDALSKSVTRILAISAIHDLLTHHSDNFSDIKSKKLFQYLTSHIEGIIDKQKNISFVFEGDEVVFDPDQATSVSMVITELIINCLKHAFSNQINGRIVLSVYEGNAHRVIAVSDNGSGFNVERTKEKSLGFTIIRLIVEEKLKGRLFIDSGSGGTVVSFDYPI